MEKKEEEEGPDAFINQFVEKRLEDNKPEYHSQLESWNVYKARIKRQSVESFHECIDKLTSGMTLFLQSDLFTPEEKIHLAEKFDSLPSEVPNQDDVPEEERKMPYEICGIDNEYVQKGYDIGISKLDEGLINEAMDIFYLLTFLDPSTYQYWLNLGMAHAMKGDHGSAILFYNIALPTSGGDSLTIMLWIVDSMVALGALEEAKAALQEVIAAAEDDPDFADAKSRAKAKLEVISTG